MFKFDMNINQNFAAFKNSDNEKIIYVDSFDNENFDVRFGTIEKTQPIKQIKASTTEQLNQQLQELSENL